MLNSRVKARQPWYGYPKISPDLLFYKWINSIGYISNYYVTNLLSASKLLIKSSPTFHKFYSFCVQDDYGNQLLKFWILKSKMTASPFWKIYHFSHRCLAVSQHTRLHCLVGCLLFKEKRGKLETFMYRTCENEFMTFRQLWLKPA